jgi:hypothetical protein
MPFDNRAAHSQTDTDTPGLRRVKRMEYVVHVVTFEAKPGIPHAQMAVAVASPPVPIGKFRGRS